MKGFLLILLRNLVTIIIAIVTIWNAWKARGLESKVVKLQDDVPAIVQMFDEELKRQEAINAELTRQLIAATKGAQTK